MSFHNYTPHKINVCEREYPSEGVARVTETQEVVCLHDGIELRKTLYGAIEGLPDPDPDGKTLFIVSMVVRHINDLSVNRRTDLVSPDTGKSCIRDEKGNIKGVTGFCV